jgi:hypothetical protein
VRLQKAGFYLTKCLRSGEGGAWKAMSLVCGEAEGEVKGFHRVGGPLPCEIGGVAHSIRTLCVGGLEGCPTFASAYVGRKQRGRSPFECFVLEWRKAFENIVFGPSTLGRIWDTLHTVNRR